MSLRNGLQRVRFHVRLRTRMRKGLKWLRGGWREGRLATRLRTRRARTISRRRQRQLAGLADLRSGLSATGPVPPRDSRGVLRAQAADGPESVDVIVCVRDALTDVHRCLASVLECSDRPLRLIVVDDGSEGPTAEYLDRLKAANPAVDLRRNPGPAHGYTIAANIGLRASRAAHLILLNSDAVVTRGWLRHLLAAGHARGDIGIVGPLSNAASHQSVPRLRDDDEWAVNELPSWLTPDGMAALVAQLPGDEVIRVPFLNGFCFCVKRRVLDAIGYLDEERFAEGYSEENDYALRAADAGFALAVATRAYVGHAKSRSYGREGREDLAKRNYGRFLSKHGEERVRPLVDGLEGNMSLTTLRERVAEAIDSPQAAASHLPSLRITFVLPGIARGGSGGSHSIYQEVKAMDSLGLPARIAIHEGCRERVKDAYQEADRLFTFYRDEDELTALLEGDDVVVATHFKSVPLVARAVAGGAAALGAYYVQDYEPLFVPPDSPDAVEAVESYRLIPDAVLFAKTEWIRDTLAEREGVAVAKVEPSLDRAVFHARGRTRFRRRAHIAAMVRPRTPRRAARETLDVLGRMAEGYGSGVRITTFGCDARELASLGCVPRAVEHRGLLSRQEVADLFRTADIFLDCSWYQAFGRTSLEAMACGATAVLPEIGGANEFAEHGVNSLLVDTRNPEQAYAAVARLLDDRGLLRRLKSSALDTASRYSSLKAALSEYALFFHELAMRHPERVRPAASTAPASTGPAAHRG